MKILLTNDDGIDAVGLSVLAEAAKKYGDIYWMAPIGAQSGCSHQVTAHAPLRVEHFGPNRFAVNGFPADCVRVALRHLRIQPDWIFSGVNHGGNLGVDVFLSGTMAAVREGAIYGIPGIGFSHYRAKNRDFDWDRVARMLPRAIEAIFELPREKKEYWSVNFPHLSAEIADPDVDFCQLDTTPMAFDWVKNGDQIDYLSHYQERLRTNGSDVQACFNGKIAITKLLL
jgi:5'-nucleotidase